MSIPRVTSHVDPADHGSGEARIETSTKPSTIFPPPQTDSLENCTSVMQLRSRQVPLREDKHIGDSPPIICNLESLRWVSHDSRFRSKEAGSDETRNIVDC